MSLRDPWLWQVLATVLLVLLVLQARRLYNICGHVLLARLGWRRRRAPRAYVRELFNGYAKDYDDHLLVGLRYAGANLVSDALNRSLERRPRDPVYGLDLGCGTGILGVLLANRIKRLVGVDLSSAMTERAAERHVYDALYEDDLLTFLNTRRDAYDVITAADVLVYLGELDHFMGAAFAALRPGGVLIFTTEAMPASAVPLDGEIEVAARELPDKEGYRLLPTGRYAHDEESLARLATEAGFAVEAQDAAVLRLQDDNPVQGFVHTLCKPE